MHNFQKHKKSYSPEYLFPRDSKSISYLLSWALKIFFYHPILIVSQDILPTYLFVLFSHLHLIWCLGVYILTLLNLLI